MNLTITVDAEVLKRARIRAIEENTSVNAVLRDRLNAYADGDRSLRDAAEEAAKHDERAVKRFIRLSETLRPAVTRPGNGGGEPGPRRWTRDELYDR